MSGTNPNGFAPTRYAQTAKQTARQNRGIGEIREGKRKHAFGQSWRPDYALTAGKRATLDGAVVENR